MINITVKIMIFLLFLLIINGFIKFFSYTVYDIYMKNKLINIFILSENQINLSNIKKINLLEKNSDLADIIITNDLDLINQYKKNFITSKEPNIIINIKNKDVITFTRVENFGSIYGYFLFQHNNKRFFIFVNKKCEINKNLNEVFNAILFLLAE